MGGIVGIPSGGGGGSLSGVWFISIFGLSYVSNDEGAVLLKFAMCSSLTPPINIHDSCTSRILWFLQFQNVGAVQHRGVRVFLVWLQEITVLSRDGRRAIKANGTDKEIDSSEGLFGIQKQLP